jgi:hypothetical protein
MKYTNYRRWLRIDLGWTFWRGVNTNYRGWR